MAQGEQRHLTSLFACRNENGQERYPILNAMGVEIDRKGIRQCLRLHLIIWFSVHRLNVDDNDELLKSLRFALSALGLSDS
jgi:hypothetical protein